MSAAFSGGWIDGLESKDKVAFILDKEIQGSPSVCTPDPLAICQHPFLSQRSGQAGGWDQWYQQYNKFLQSAAMLLG